jgi:hypothetical protein
MFGKGLDRYLCLACEAENLQEVVMPQNERRNLKTRFDQYQPNKTQLFWACVGSVVLVLVVGFSGAAR